MPNLSGRWPLTYPDGTSAFPPWQQHFETLAQSMADALDDNGVPTAGLLANRPAPAVAGRTYFATDTGFLWYDTGSAWIAPPIIQRVGRATGAAVAGLSLNNVFSSAFKRYKITGHLRMSASNNINVRFRSGGVDNSGASDYSNSRIWLNTTSSVTGSNANASAFTLSGIAAIEFDFAFEVQGVQDSAEQAQGEGQCSGRGGVAGNTMTNWSGHHATTLNFDGISVLAGAGTLTGELVAYGLP